MVSSPQQISPLIKGLLEPSAYPHPVETVRLIETHISWVLLTGKFVYKLKKPVDFGFLDYTTLERRHHFCNEELRLNRRLAADLYLDVVPITGTADTPRMEGMGEALEYAVKMRQFPDEAQLDRMLAAGELTGKMVDELADLLARLHRHAAVARPGEGLGGLEQVAANVMANFELTRRFVPDWIDRDTYDHLSTWSSRFLDSHAEMITARLADGFVRECHGDAHLKNAALLEADKGKKRIVLFDCIEFNPAFRFTDVMAEIAFAAMDLDAKGRPDLAGRLINRYLEDSGDYAGVALLPLYLSYRAYVRAKVTALSPDAAEQVAAIRHQVALADGYTRPRNAGLIVMHGVTGTGKSTVAAALAQGLGAICIRSDVERKRLAGVSRTRQSSAGAGAVGTGIYSADMTGRTYRRLEELAALVLQAGFPVILDATYLDAGRRAAALRVAAAAGVPGLVIDCTATRAELERRVMARSSQADAVSDATLEVLHAQLSAAVPLSGEELSRTIPFDTETQTPDDLVERVSSRLAAAA